jgi:serine/threonine protein kinase/Flp pilus assembly protein TadD
MSEQSVSANGSLEERVASVVDGFMAEAEAGGRPDVEDYARRHPELASVLRQVLPALGLIGSAGGPGAGAATAAAPGEEIGGVLGDFRLLREVGHGGMGIVYEAEQLSLNRRVALKVLPFAATMDPRQLQRFHNEARAAASLHHEHIVPVYAVGQERGVHYYAMQFIDGHTLAEVIARQRGAAPADTPTEAAAAAAPSAATAGPAAQATGPAPRDAAYFRRAAEWGVQAAEALEHAHSLGVVHRDVKPGNLLLDGRGKLWVTDFGLARFGADGGLTMTGDLLGTLRYMSPEQALAKHGLVDHRTDIYSLGATLYELLTLRPVIDGRDRQEVLRKIAFEEPAPPRALDRGIPADLETVVLKALAKEPAERYATAQELADDLRRFLEHRPVQARRPSLVQRARKWARRHRTGVAAALVCLLVAVAAGAISIGYVLGERANRQKAAESKVQEALESAAALLPKGNPYDPVQITALQQAEAQAVAGAVGPGWRGRVRQLRQDVDMLRRLDEANLQLAAGGKEGLDWAGADQRYTEAFREYGFDVAFPDADKAVEQVRASAIRTHLLVALDNWALVRRQVKPESEAPLRELAERADDDPWRRELRQAVKKAKRGEGDALAALAKKPVPPDQPPVFLFSLGLRPDEAEALLRAAQQRYPGDFWINFQLALALYRKQASDSGEAIRYYQAALTLRPHSSAVHTNLGLALYAKGRLNEAIAELKKAIALDAKNALAHNSLGYIFSEEGRFDDAIAEYHKAIGLDPKSAGFHSNLGDALRAKGRLDEAITECQKAIELDPKFALASRVIGHVRFIQGRLDEAITEVQKSIALDPKYAPAHYYLGIILKEKGRPDEAIAAYRKAIDLNKDYAEAHCNLGLVLREKGRFAEALQEVRRGHELGSKSPRWRYPSAQWVKESEYLAALDAKLSRVLKGELKPADVRERVNFAWICQEYKKRYTASVRFYTDAFAEQPKMANDLVKQFRYNAACAAARAGCGQGKDADQTDDQERARLRRQALEWLRADLAVYRKDLEMVPDKAGPEIRSRMQQWQKDKDLAGVRDPAALAELPEDERREWQKLWADVTDTLARAAEKPGPEKKSTTK